MFQPYLYQWGLVADGEPILTPGSRLLPVRQNCAPAMLKIALDTEEKLGGLLMAWWDGHGAAKVLAHDDGAVLLERALGERSLLEMALRGEDDDATRIACDVAAQLHAPRATPAPDLVPLAQWFASLPPAAARHGGMFRTCLDTANALLATQRDVVPLHGDIHHTNILDFGQRGWLAIDPKRVIGERGYDYANLFCNPDIADIATPARLRRQLDIVTGLARLERERILRWIVAYAGLSAAWFLEDDMPEEAEKDFAIARQALAELTDT
jgi:streptomycin 6-kinase